MTPTPASTPSPTPTPTPTQVLGYTLEQIATACAPAIEEKYPGGQVASSATGIWIYDEQTADIEFHVDEADGTSFPVMCTVTNVDPAAPTVTYVGVVDI